MAIIKATPTTKDTTMTHELELNLAEGETLTIPCQSLQGAFQMLDICLATYPDRVASAFVGNDLVYADTDVA